MFETSFAFCDTSLPAEVNVSFMLSKNATPNVSVYTLLLYFYGEKRFPALLHISKHIIAYFGGYFNECTKLSEASYIVVFESFDRIVFFDLMHGVHHAGKYNHKDTKDNDGNTAPWDLETDVHCT